MSDVNSKAPGCALLDYFAARAPAMPDWFLEAYVDETFALYDNELREEPTETPSQHTMSIRVQAFRKTGLLDATVRWNYAYALSMVDYRTRHIDPEHLTAR